MSRTRRISVLIIVLAVFVCIGFSTVMAVHKGNPRSELAYPIIEPIVELPHGLMAIPYEESGKLLRSPLGQTFLLGTTWYDNQHNGSIGRMIALAPSRGVHFCWMNGLNVNAVDRHIYYNYYNPTTGGIRWPGVGYQVDQIHRAGFTTLSQFSGGEAVIGYHAKPTATSGWNTQIAYDVIEGFGAFQTTDLPNLSGWDKLMWPHVAVCSQDYIHVVSTENKDIGWRRIAYAQSTDGGETYSTFTVVDTVINFSSDVATSPVSNKVGIAYTRSIFNPLNMGPYDGMAASQRNNDVVLIESEDGTTWNFLDRRNITNLSWPDTSFYPDTVCANGDTLRAYCDVSLLYDHADNAHVAFTTKGLWFDARLAAHPDSFAVVGITRDASVIWHWNELLDTLTVIAEGWYDVGDTDTGFNSYKGAGERRSTVDRPSLGLDSLTGYLYCLYVRCMPGDTSGGFLISHGWANGELFCSVSTDGGLNWSEPVNLTDTPSPGCMAGNCMDEDYSSLAEVVNDTLHIIYIEDKDAGAVVQTAPQEGTWTENPVRYLRVPADQVPPGPPYVPNFSFHVRPKEAVPIVLSSFQANEGSGYIALEWVTASEIDCHQWEVYRSDLEDGEYAKIAELPGHGSTETDHVYQWIDRGIIAGKTFFYKLRQVDFDGTSWWSHSVSSMAAATVPKTYALHQNHPNPFNASTEIRYQIPEDGHITLKIFNTLGQEVRTLVDGDQRVGDYMVQWDGRDVDGREVASGLYFCRLRAGEFSKTIKMVLVK